ncbi:Hypothetical protein, putative [Bodo saltans]|uniref:Leucine-rich repeat protein n=1 Tax=Bodo saltans TaxID=75058 RepID=A0A0S4IQG1_BODSA|nr:Hypothetical protein, putative [Bodo saltans]|eukprot:CUF95445.1 Hypothetical protein, putative [Bodo saltans]
MPSVSAPYIPLVRVQPQGLYLYFCKELDLHPNSGVVERLAKVCLLCGVGAVGVDTPSSADTTTAPEDHSHDDSTATEGIVVVGCGDRAVDSDAQQHTITPDVNSSLPAILAEDRHKSDTTNATGAHRMTGGTGDTAQLATIGNNNSLSSSSSLCEGSTDSILNLSSNFVGSEGLRPLLQTIRVVHFFTKLDLSGHGVNSDDVAEIVKYLDGVHSLRSLALNQNPRITQAGGRYLKLFAASNVNVSDIQVDGTSITLALKKVIYGLCNANQALRKNPVLYEDKALWQHRRRHSVGMMGSSPQPTPMKRDKQPVSISPLASSRGAGDAAAAVGHGSASRQDSASRGNSTVLMSHPAADAQRQPPAVILPPFYSAPFLPALLHADGILLTGGGGSSRVSPPVTPMRPTNMSAPSSEDVLRRVGGGDVAVSVSPAAVDPLEGPLEAIDYVFASALPHYINGGQQQPRHASSQHAITRASPHDEFPALQLLRDAMYDLQ